VSGGRYLLRRLALALIVVAGVLVITFVISRVVPNDPARLYAGARARPEQLAAVREQLRLDDPLPAQFVRYVGQLLRGDLGQSFRTKRAIVEDLRAFLPATMELVLLATLLAVAVGIPLGVMSAARRGKMADHLARLVAIAGVSLPAFWLALLAQLVFFGWLGWLPLGGRLGRDILLTQPIQQVTGFHLVDAAVTGNWPAWRDALWHLVLPVAVLATYPVGLVARMTRAAMIEVLNETYVTAAEASGLPRRQVLFRFALKNAIIPTLTVLGLTFAFSVTGAVLVEIVFSWPGVGKYVTDAIVAADYPVVVAVTLVVTVIYVLVNLVIDLLQAALDPRIELR
jgi:peptide/nickel transport system permease protein